MKRILWIAMSRISCLLAACVASAPSLAGVYVTGSTVAGSTNMAYSGYRSQYSSGSIGFDVASILRLGYTYSQEDTINDGYTDSRSADALKSQDATAANANDDPSDDGNLVAYNVQSRVIGNSVDLQIVLYKGDVVVPFVIGGVIHKQITSTTSKEGETPAVRKEASLGPQAGAGLGFRLNRQFSFKVTQMASPGEKRKPFEEKATKVWDRKLTLGLTYEL